MFLAALLLAPNACSRPTMSQKKNKSHLAVYLAVSSASFKPLTEFSLISKCFRLQRKNKNILKQYKQLSINPFSAREVSLLIFYK